MKHIVTKENEFGGYTRKTFDGEFLYRIEYLNNLEELHSPSNGKEYEPASITYYNHNRGILKEVWYRNGVKHRYDGPAIIQYRPSSSNITNKFWFQCWYQDGKIHRDNDPAFIVYYENGNIDYYVWYYYSKIHRDPRIYLEEEIHQPAITEFDEDSNIKSEKYYLNNKEYKLSEIIDFDAL